MKKIIQEEIIRTREIMGLKEQEEGTVCQTEAQEGINDCYDTHFNTETETMGPGYQACHDSVMVEFRACKKTGVVKEFVTPRGYDEEFEYEDTPKREDSFLERLKAKLKGVSEEQMEYNREHSLPLDWRGSKEGYHEHITNKQFYSGSN